MDTLCINACIKLKKSTSFNRKITFLYLFSKNHIAASEKTRRKRDTRDNSILVKKLVISKDFILSMSLYGSIYIKVYVLLFTHLLNKIKCFKSSFYYKIWSFSFPLVVFLPPRFSAIFIVWDLFPNVWKEVIIFCPKQNTHLYTLVKTYLLYR